MVHELNGDLLEADVDYICHQVNCQGRMKSGIAKSIREKYPEVYQKYMDFYNQTDDTKCLLGIAQVVDIADRPSVINMFSQYDYGYDGKRYTSYDAFWSCLGQILEKVPRGAKIGFPARIGCDRGGANWSVIRQMIYTISDYYDIYIYNL